MLYDDPKKASGADKKEQPKVEADRPEEDAEKCTTNTDKIDREIKKLKEKKQQLEQQIKEAASMPFTAYQNSYLQKDSLMCCQSGQNCCME